MNIKNTYLDAISNRESLADEILDPEILDALPTLDECISFGNELMEIIDSMRDRISVDDPAIITINQMITSSFDVFRDIMHLMSRRDFSYDSPSLAFAMREMYSNFRDIFYLLNNLGDINRKLDFLCLKNIELMNLSRKVVEACKRQFRHDYICKKSTNKRIIINRWIDKSDKDLWNEGYNALKPETPIDPDDIKVLVGQLSTIGHLNQLDSLFRKSEKAVRARNVTDLMQILYMSYLILELTYKDVTGVVLRDRTELFDKLKKWIDGFSAILNKKGLGGRSEEK